MHRVIIRSLLGATAGAAAVLPGAAVASSATVYVSPAGAAGAADHSCATAAYYSVQAAVNAAPAQGTVIVCRGTYRESITVSKRLTLTGHPGATIDASGHSYGVGAAASYVTVAHLTVENASVGGLLADGIVTAGLADGTMVPASHVTIEDNLARDNDGSGIDLNSTSYSRAAGNRATGNSVGVNVSDDFSRPCRPQFADRQHHQPQSGRLRDRPSRPHRQGHLRQPRGA
jgi:parallel beta-helix repeat protein